MRYYKMRKNYASKLTIEMLLKSGITEITRDGRVFCGSKEKRFNTFKNNKYKTFNICSFDENGNKIKRYTDNSPGHYVYKETAVSLHRAMWAWFYGEAPEGYIVDHIDNNYLNNTIENLQLLTPAENVRKGRKANGLKTNYIPAMKRSGYTKEEILTKIDYYTALYEKAKQEHDAEKAHKLRTNISQWRRRLELLFGEDEDQK